jgi:DNA-binding MarR family transcriptional regulator
MKPIFKTLKLDKIEYYVTHLSIINCVLPTKLTPKEIEVLAWFMSFDGDIARDRFGTTAKKIVRESLNISHQGLSNYMKSLSDKKFLLEQNGNTSILPLLHPDKNEQTYFLKLINFE